MCEFCGQGELMESARDLTGEMFEKGQGSAEKAEKKKEMKPSQANSLGMFNNLR